MNINHTVASLPNKRNVYEITIDTYKGDMDGNGHFKFKCEPQDIGRIILELLVVQNQFTHGRGGCRKMYDQSEYFCRGDELTDEQWGVDMKNFHWLEPENDFPYDWQGEQNHTINTIDIVWFNDQGIKHKVTHDKNPGFVTDLHKLNSKHHIGDYTFWEDIQTRQYNRKSPAITEEEFQTLFDTYRQDVINLIDNYLKTMTCTYPGTTQKAPLPGTV